MNANGLGKCACISGSCSDFFVANVNMIRSRVYCSCPENSLITDIVLKMQALRAFRGDDNCGIDCWSVNCKFQRLEVAHCRTVGQCTSDRCSHCVRVLNQ